MAVHGLHARSRLLFGRNVVYCAEWLNSSIKDLIYGRLSSINNFYVRRRNYTRWRGFLEGAYYDSGQFTFLIRLAI